MVVLALDVGEARIGLATSDPTGTLATPRGVVRRRSTAAAIAAIARVVDETAASAVVVGLPISLDGSLNAQARRIQAFAERLRAQVRVPVMYWDERLSTVTAAEALRAAGVRPERIAERIDAAAAAVILQDYLDHQRQIASDQAGGPDSTAAAPDAAEPERGGGG
jgi:putative Holliday junction resolvase